MSESTNAKLIAEAVKHVSNGLPPCECHPVEGLCDWCGDEWPCLPRQLADALAEHDRVIAEKAWDAGALAEADAAIPGNPPLTNPHRANPDPGVNELADRIERGEYVLIPRRVLNGAVSAELRRRHPEPHDSPTGGGRG